MFIKICGIQDEQTALAAVAAGADFLGLICVPTTKRYIDIQTAEEIIQAVKGKVKTVGVFQNQPLEEVTAIAEKLGLDYVQLHGQETPEYTQQLKIKVIKTFALHSVFDVEDIKNEMKTYHVDYYLVDRQKVGEGEPLQTDLVEQLAKDFPIILAGGLTPDTIGEIVQHTDCEGVDVSSGVETDGQKDIQKIKDFIQHGKGINNGR